MHTHAINQRVQGRHSKFNRFDITKHTAGQAKVPGTNASRAGDDVHRKKLAARRILGLTKKLIYIQVYPTGRDRKDMLTTAEYVQQR